MTKQSQRRRRYLPTKKSRWIIASPVSNQRYHQSGRALEAIVSRVRWSPALVIHVIGQSNCSKILPTMCVFLEEILRLMLDINEASLMALPALSRYFLCRQRYFTISQLSLKMETCRLRMILGRLMRPTKRWPSIKPHSADWCRFSLLKK